ncbi:MAG TPA: hypothetical protein VLA10_04315 [Ilumatobacter sp.]|nr:hypothetical protein [Ilumatobacter sp.]
MLTRGPIETRRTNYDEIAGLPDFRLFTWFFLVPGVVLVGLAAFGLFGKRKRDDAVAVAPVDARSEDREPQLV